MRFFVRFEMKCVKWDSAQRTGILSGCILRLFHPCKRVWILVFFHFKSRMNVRTKTKMKNAGYKIFKYLKTSSARCVWSRRFWERNFHFFSFFRRPFWTTTVFFHPRSVSAGIPIFWDFSTPFWWCTFYSPSPSPVSPLFRFYQIQLLSTVFFRRCPIFSPVLVTLHLNLYLYTVCNRLFLSWWNGKKETHLNAKNNNYHRKM